MSNIKNPAQKYALITGAGGGLANACISELLKENYIIFALDLSTTILFMYKENKNVIPIVCDITDETQVANAYEEISKTTDKLHVVGNFAGIICMGSLIERPTAQLEKIINVNLIGMYRINKHAFEFVKNAGGRYINISSEYGVLDAVPFNTFYTISKHAIEVYSDGLRREIAKFGIPVIKIRPGAFKTNMQASVGGQFNDMLQESKYFEAIFLNMKGMMEREVNKAKDASIMAKTFIRAVNANKPRIAYNTNNSKTMKLLSSLPQKLQDKIYKSYFK